MPEWITSLLQNSAIPPALAAAAVAWFAWRRDKPEKGALAVDKSMDAAGKALDMQEDAYERQLAIVSVEQEHLKARVTRLEEMLIEKEEKIVLLEEERSLLLRWIAALSEQITQNGVVPISLEEIKHLDGFGDT